MLYGLSVFFAFFSLVVGVAALSSLIPHLFRVLFFRPSNYICKQAVVKGLVGASRSDFLNRRNDSIGFTSKACFLTLHVEDENDDLYEVKPEKAYDARFHIDQKVNVYFKKGQVADLILSPIDEARKDFKLFGIGAAVCGIVFCVCMLILKFS